MKWRLAQYRAWHLPAIWVAGDEPRAQLTATAETVPQATIVHVVHHYLPPGSDGAGLGLALPPGSVVTTTEEE
jgi:hypothetical protein